MFKKCQVLVFTVCTVLATSAHAQFGLSKLPLGKKGGAGDPTQTFTQCNGLVKYVTVATDQGVQAMDELAKAFPHEKVADFAELSKRYHELQTNRKEGNIDAQGVQLASQMGAEWDKIASDWQSYNKESAQSVRNADHRLALMALADGVAGTKVPETMKSLQSSIESLSHDPLQIGKLGELKAYAQMFTVIGQELPKQIKSANNVRSIAKQIATAENLTLLPDPPASSVSDVATITSNAQDLPSGQ